MSSSTTRPGAWHIEITDFDFSGNYFTVAAAVVILYDWIINLPREVKAFWTGGFSAISCILYLFTRFVAFSTAIVGVLQLVLLSHESCWRVSLATLVLGFMSYIPLAVFTALRAYALSQGRCLSILILLFFLIPTITSAMQVKYLKTTIADPIVGCLIMDEIPKRLDIMYRVTNRAGAILAILADVLLLAITWRLLQPALGRPWRHRVKAILRTNGLASVMLRDGAIYFIVLLLLNVLDLVVATYQIVAKPSTNIVAADIFWVMLTACTCFPFVLICRFLLDLQEAHQRKVVRLVSGDDALHTTTSSDLSVSHRSMSSFGFAAALSVLGATIEPSVSWELTDDEDNQS